MVPCRGTHPILDLHVSEPLENCSTRTEYGLRGRMMLNYGPASKSFEKGRHVRLLGTPGALTGHAIFCGH